MTKSSVAMQVERVAKKFSKDLRTSLRYGLEDLTRDLLGLQRRVELRKSEFWALRDISFELNRSQCLGIIGHNGAGKTTLLKVLTGLIAADEGTIRHNGRIGAMIALGAGFNPVLTGKENLYINATVLGMTKKEIASKYDEIVSFAGLEDFMDSPVQNYSSGMSVRLGFAIAIHTRPEILILDEILAVGDASFQAKCFNTLSRLRQDGVSFILVTHNMHQMERHADQILYLSHGEMKYLGDPESAIERYLDEMREAEAAPASGKGTVERPASCSRDYRIVCWRFLNTNGQEVSHLSPSEPFVFEVDFERIGEDDCAPYIDIIVRDGERQVTQQSSRGSKCEPMPKYSIETIAFKFPAFQLNVAAVRFYFTLMNPKTKRIHDWVRGVTLSFHETKPSESLLCIKVKPEHRRSHRMLEP